MSIFFNHRINIVKYRNIGRLNKKKLFMLLSQQTLSILLHGLIVLSI